MALDLSQKQKDYLDELEDYYDLHGHYPTTLQVHLITNDFIAALASRDLPPTEQTKDSPLTPTQRAAIRLILDYNDRRPLKAKLDTLNTSSARWNQWLKQPQFTHKFNQELNKRFTGLDATAKLALAHLVAANDLPAIKYFHEMTGIYRPTQETSINITLVFGHLMEVLSRHIPPELLSTIADEIERQVIPLLDPSTANSLPPAPVGNLGLPITNGGK